MFRKSVLPVPMRSGRRNSRNKAKGARPWVKLLVSLGVIEGLAVIIYQGVRKLKENYHNIFFCKSEKLIYEDDFLGDSLAACGSRLVVELQHADFYSRGQVLDIFAVFSDIAVQVPQGMDVYLDVENSRSYLSGVYAPGEDNNEDAFLILRCRLYGARVEVEERT